MKDPPLLSRARRKHPDLLFEWVDSRSHRWRLVVFLNLSLALHVACFYAFQVVYPPTIRQRAQTTKVTFLDPRKPEVRDVIARIEDRAIFFDGSLHLPAPRAEQPDVVFERGFAVRDPELRLPEEVREKPALPQIFAADDVFLPPRSRLLPDGVQSGRPEPFAGPYVYRPRMLQQGEIAGRECVRTPDWSDVQKDFAAATGIRIQFLIEVDAAGRVTNCLPWDGVEAVFDNTMASKIETETRFKPSSQASRGWLELRW